MKDAKRLALYTPPGSRWALADHEARHVAAAGELVVSVLILSDAKAETNLRPYAPFPIRALSTFAGVLIQGKRGVLVRELAYCIGDATSRASKHSLPGETLAS